MKEPSRTEVWKMFDAISPTYDRINRILSLGMDRSWRSKAAEHLPTKENLALLDLATGTADQLIALFDSKASIKSAIGIDLSSEMLSIGKKKIDQKPYKEKVSLQRGDAEKIPFKDASFHAVSLSFGIRNVIDPLTSMKEIHRVLKKGGKCLILEFSLPPKPIRPFYLFYLRHILPYIGALFSKSKNAYRYLNQTIETFPSGNAFLDLLEKAEFTKKAAYPMAFGAVTLYVAEK